MTLRHPVFIPSKGRYQKGRALTVAALQRDEVPFTLVVEPQERDDYLPLLSDRDRLLVLPFSNLGQGSIPARNFVRETAEREGAAKHHQLDDNISMFFRLWERRRIPCDAGAALRVLELFSDRFENVGVSGLSYDMFVIPTNGWLPNAYVTNTHVYSCTLVNHAMPCRWRGRYNEDADLCLQALTSGWATVQLVAFMAKKTTTMTVAGGNTDDLYSDGTDERDTLGRFEMARALERSWPGLVRVARKFGRYQHSVNWLAFRNFPRLVLRDDVDLATLPENDELGLALAQVREPKSDRIATLRDEYPATVAALGCDDPLWRGLPAFRPNLPSPRLALKCGSAAERDELVAQLGVTVDKRYVKKAWSAPYPPRGREDPASLRFVNSVPSVTVGASYTKEEL